MANFSPVNRAETSARLLKQILLKSNCRLHGEGFSPGRNSARAKILARFAQTGLGFSARAKGPENLKNSHVIKSEFQPGLNSELGHARLIFQPGLKFAM